ncbi:hypothetical protein OQA88_1911 [Cercophora sp. LCS_1]
MAGVSHLPSHAGYASDAMLDELSRQLAAANNSRRLSRGTGSQRMGNAMRIVKPGSANNSPRSSMLPARRRTLIGEHQRPHLQPVEASYLPTPTPELHKELGYEPEQRPARPVSWHPSSQQLSQQYCQQTMSYAFNNYKEAEIYNSYQQLPPTPTVYSGYTSPCSTFSPLSLPYSSAPSQQYYSPTSQTLSQPQQPQHTQQQLPTPVYQQSPIRSTGSAVQSSEMAYLPAPKVSNSSLSSLDWDTFAAQGFDKYAAPPTPEDFVPNPPARTIETTPTKLPVEEPFKPMEMEDDESEGEILYGMGLYDAPEQDSVLDFHRSAVFSLLGGQYPEPTGKGLKLEEGWEPPVSDDEDEADGEGDEQDEDEDE